MAEIERETAPSVEDPTTLPQNGGKELSSCFSRRNIKPLQSDWMTAVQLLVLTSCLFPITPFLSVSVLLINRMANSGDEERYGDRDGGRKGMREILHINLVCPQEGVEHFSSVYAQQCTTWDEHFSLEAQRAQVKVPWLQEHWLLAVNLHLFLGHVSFHSGCEFK